MKDFEAVLEYVELPQEHRAAEVRAAAAAAAAAGPHFRPGLPPPPDSTARHQLTATPAHPFHAFPRPLLGTTT